MVEDQLLWACMRGDRAAVDVLLAGDRGLPARAAAAEPDAVNRAVRLGRQDAVRLLVGLGFDVNVVRRTTALHEAAAGDDLPMVELLLELGADLSAVDREFGATPLGWALHNRRDAVAAYLTERSP
jgi:ankyrin repeat protein